MFPTMWGSILATDSFNSDEKARTCTECGHVNAPFPEEAWGWQNYVDRHEVVNSTATSPRREREEGGGEPRRAV